MGTGGSAAGTGGTSSGGGAATGGAVNTGGGAPVDDCTIGTGSVDVGSSSFTDKATCLTWQKAPTVTGGIGNKAALLHCNTLAQDGFDDWRLPTAQELRSYPSLPTNGNAYLAGPTYIPNNSVSDSEGCTGNSHSCNLTQYSDGNFSCAWQGPGENPYPVLCVRGAAAIALDAAFVVATCGNCGTSSTYKPVDCSAY